MGRFIALALALLTLVCSLVGPAQPGVGIDEEVSRGSSAYRDGDYVMAVACWCRTLPSQVWPPPSMPGPDREQVLKRCIQFFCERGMYREARALLDSCGNVQDPPTFPRSIVAARIYVEVRDPKGRPLAMLDRLHTDLWIPSRGGALTACGEDFGMVPQLRPLLQQHVAAHRNEADGLNTHGRDLAGMLAAGGDPDSACTTYEALLAAHKQRLPLPHVAYALAELYAGTYGRYQDALALVERYPDMPTYAATRARFIVAGDRQRPDYMGALRTVAVEGATSGAVWEALSKAAEADSGDSRWYRALDAAQRYGAEHPHSGLRCALRVLAVRLLRLSGCAARAAKCAAGWQMEMVGTPEWFSFVAEWSLALRDAGEAPRGARMLADVAPLAAYPSSSLASASAWARQGRDSKTVARLVQLRRTLGERGTAMLVDLDWLVWEAQERRDATSAQRWVEMLNSISIEHPVSVRCRQTLRTLAGDPAPAGG